MTKQISRRQSLKMIGGAGALAILGGAGCFRATPTRPANYWANQTDRALSFVNATIIDVETGTALKDKVVLVQDGLILGVYDTGAPELANSRPIDCGGAYMIPGLINAHCHISAPSIMNPSLGDMGTIREQITKNYEDAIGWGVTLVRDMGTLPKILLRDREAIDKGQLAGPRILSAISMIAVPDGYPDFSKDESWLARQIVGRLKIRTTNAAEAADAVKTVRDLGANLVKISFDHQSFIYGRGALSVLSDAQVDAIKNEAAKSGLPVAAHHLYSQGLDRALQFDIDTIEHLVMDQALTDGQVQKILTTKTPIIPTAMVGLSMAFKTHGDPSNGNALLCDVRKWRNDVQFGEMPLHCIDPIQQKLVALRKFYEAGDYAKPENASQICFDPRLASAGLITGLQNLKRLIAEDAVLGVGNDSGVPFVFPGMLHLEMEMLVRMGMPPAKALLAATLVNAKICGLEQKCGTIAAGKWADLVLLEANPLDDVRNVAKVKAVFKGGAVAAKADGFEVS